MAAHEKTAHNELLDAVLGFGPFWRAVAEHQFPSPLSLFLLISGGPDSVGLALGLHDFAKLAADPPKKGLHELLPPSLKRTEYETARKYFSRPREVKLTLLHLNHSLRPSAEDEEAWVKDFAKRRGVRCECETQDVAGYARLHRTSVEDAGRVIRYAMLTRKLEADPAALGFTAHTMDDNTESVLYSLAQRAGIAGMLGIAPELHGHILRPFLHLRKQTILAELKRRRQKYVTDETNLVPDRPRTFLRHEVVPRLLELNPKFLENTLATCANLQGYDGLIRWALDSVTKLASAEDIQWRRRLLLPLLPPIRWHAFAPASWGEEISGSLAVIFYHLLRMFGATLNWSASARLADAVAGDYSYRAKAGRGVAVEHHPPSGLVFVVQRDEPASYELRDEMLALGPQKLEISQLQGEALEDSLTALAENEPRVSFANATGGFGELRTPGARYEAVFSAAAPQPLKVRPPKRGDRIKLPGGEGHAKLSDVFVNAKVPHSLRSHWPVVTDAKGGVLWLPGLVRGGAARVPKGARSGVKLSWEVGR